jgi:RNA polymerase sigma factor (sigma-70 family)
LNELETITKISAGDRQAFKKLYDDYGKRVYNTALSVLQKTEDAEEITQDVFVEVFKSANKFKGDSSIATWIYRITINKSLDLLRHRKRKKRSAFLVSLFTNENKPIVQPTDFAHPGILMENAEKAHLLFKAIELLPPQQKAAFVLAQVEDLPQKEIATIMKLSPKAVESLIQRAKVNLKKELIKAYPQRGKHAQ